jgi:hypothetical protein
MYTTGKKKKKKENRKKRNKELHLDGKRMPKTR